MSMHTKNILSSQLGRQYLVCFSHQSSIQSSGLKFWDVRGAQQFVGSLSHASQTWQQIAMQSTDYLGWKSIHPWANIEEFIALLLSQGKLKAIDVTTIRQWKSAHKAHQTLKDNFGNQYQFIPAAASLFNKPTNTKRFTSNNDAQQFIQQLNLSEEEAKTIAQSLQLPKPSKQSPLENLAQALVNGDVVLTKEQPQHSPPKTEFETVPAEQVQPAGLGPTSAPSTPKVEAEPSFDEAATADALQKAAEDGTPFCEECEKAKAAQAA